MRKKNFQSIRGMRDLYGEDAKQFEMLLAIIRQKLNNYGYHPFHPPILEDTRLFSHSIGEATDVVEKEMFSFEDYGDQVTMRPEATAGMVRALIQNGMTFGSHKLWTAGPMFRRERPQKGRYRQFYQVSVEAFGIADPEQDAEQILLAAELWQHLGIAEYVRLAINTLATPEVRQCYRDALVAYFSTNSEQLDDDSQRRLAKNPLRILDSKNPAMQSLIADAPKLVDYLDKTSQQHFNRVLSCLHEAGVDYHIEPTLVRGLDYYNHTVYEWTTDQLGSQGAIGGGGRYDGLSEHIGGKPMPAVGFALGIDRILLLIQTLQKEKKFQKIVPLAYFVLIGEVATRKGLLLANQLRATYPKREILTHLADSGMKAQFKKADQSGAEYAIIIGDNELACGRATVKNLGNGNQRQVAFNALANEFNQELNQFELS